MPKIIANVINRLHGNIATENPGVKAATTPEENDKNKKKREEELERWMKNIKEFIRGIDVQSL